MRQTTDFQIIREFVEAVLADLPEGVATSDWAEELISIVGLTSFRAGEVIVQHHELATSIHFLVQGTLRNRQVVGDQTEGELVSYEMMPWTPVGLSSLRFHRHRITATAETDVRMLSVRLDALRALAAKRPRLWAVLTAFMFRRALGLLWVVRGRQPGWDAPKAEPLPELPSVAGTALGDFDDLFEQSPQFASVPHACRHWLAGQSRLFRAEAGTKILEEGQTTDGLWLLANGRVERRCMVLTADGKERSAARFCVRPGTLLCWSALGSDAPAPYTIVATRNTALAYVPREALMQLLSERPDWVGAIFQQQIWQLRNFVMASRTHDNEVTEDGGIRLVEELIDDSMPVLPVNSMLYGVPYLLCNRMTRRDGFRRLYRAHFQGTDSERTVASLALDLLRNLERSHRFFSGMQATYDAVVNNAHLDPAALRKLSTRYFRDALSHVPYVIKGMENLPDDGNCILIYNHMAYAEDSVLPNGFLFNPDSHFISGEILEPKYGDGLRIARTNAKTEYWRADYYERLGHISVDTPESGRGEVDEETKRARRRKFLDECQAAVEGGRPFSIAPEGTITEEESTTEKSPGPFKAGAFIMSGRFPSRPKIVPVALANFDKPAYRAVYSCVIKPPFTMKERGIDVNDRESLGPFLESYRREFRGHVEEAIELAQLMDTPGADLTGLVTNLDRLDDVSEEFEHDVRALELRSPIPTHSGPKTVFYGSSTIRLWTSLAEDTRVPGAVNLGFGGSTIEACRHYFERLVLPHAPDRLVIYVGENDIARGSNADFVAAQFRELADIVGSQLPDARCWFISIKPSPDRIERIGEIQEANAKIASEIEQRDAWRYVDWFHYMLDDRGNAPSQLFQPDRVHVNRAGYSILGRLLRDELVAAG